MGLARALWQQGELFKALAVVQTALRLAPNDSTVRALLPVTGTLRHGVKNRTVAHTWPMIGRIVRSPTAPVSFRGASQEGFPSTHASHRPDISTSWLSGALSSIASTSDKTPYVTRGPQAPTCTLSLAGVSRSGDNNGNPRGPSQACLHLSAPALPACGAALDRHLDDAVGAALVNQEAAVAATRMWRMMPA